MSTGTSSPETSCSPPTVPSTSSDFGLTRRVDEGASLTEAGELVGSIDYAAPEQIDGRAVDGRADVYSLACVTYECLTGSVPFPRDSPMAKLWAHLRDSPLPAAAINPDLPSELDPVLQRGLAKNPDDRYPTASELTDGVQTAVALPAPPSTAQRSRRTLIAGTLAALAAIAALTVALVLTLGGESTRPDPILPLAGDSVVGIDSASGEVTAAVAVQEPGPIAAGLGFVWIIDQSELIQIDPETARRRVVRLDEPFPEGTWPPSIAAGEGSIWLAFAGTNGGASGRWLWRVNAATGEIVKLDRAIDAGAVVVGSGAVWVNVFTIDSDGLLKILPRAVEVAHSIDGPEERFLTKMAIGATGLWVLLASSIDVSPSTKNELWRIDPASGATLARLDLSFVPADFAVDATSLWVVNPSADEVVQLDPETGAVRSTVRVGRIPGAIAVSGGTVWVANTRDGTVSRIDSETLDVTTIRVGGKPGGLAATQDGVWVSVSA